MVATKDTLHRLIDDLPDDDLGTLQAVLEFWRIRNRLVHGLPVGDELRSWLEDAQSLPNRADVLASVDWPLLLALLAPKRKPAEESEFTADDPVLKALEAAPWDDETETPEEAEAVRKAREAAARGEVISNAELRRRVGW